MPQAPASPDRSQLSLFDEPPAAGHAAPRAERVSAPPAPPPAPVVAAPEFRHPGADREVLLNGHRVAYAFRRARRRSIGFTVNAEGLSVSAPRWVGVGEVEAALQVKAGWILRKLQEQRARARRLAEARIDWRDGTTVPYLGEPVIVVLDPRCGDGAWLNSDASALPGVPRHTLHVALPHTATAEQIRDAVQSWLQRQAKRLFEERCAHFAQQLGVRVKRLSLSSAQTRWGSASADGSIRLHWRLIHFAQSTIDYVVAHEVAHLREMNHSPAFWDVVRSVVPDYERVRGALKDDVLPAFE
jgi:predicted metal-dependent hydrolase